MARNNQSKNKIGTDFLHNLYSDISLETKDPQPYYIVHKDTFKTFLYEHKDSLNYGDKALSFLGIEVSVIVSLFTCDFKNLLGNDNKIIVDGKTIQGVFICSALVIGGFFLYYGIKWLYNVKKTSINYMCSELEKKSSLLIGKNNIQEDTPQNITIVNDQGVITRQQEEPIAQNIKNNLDKSKHP
ncbi:MAG: hypothetical protein IKZ86_03760 [Spirochaetaceae bacterium]|nr:hypothetical protein [Spirochaetaceae bacterium]